MNKLLKEHREFRNQLIIVSLVLLIGGFVSDLPELTAFGIVFGLIALWNVFSYRQNLKDFNKLNK